MISAIAAHQVLVLRRQRTFLGLLLILMVMTALAGVIGWSSQRTVQRVYDLAVPALQSSNQPVPPNPFDAKPTLSLLSNMSIYIPLIGALLALVVGHLSIVGDDAPGIGRLIFSRQVTRSTYLLGKLLGIACVLAVVLTACLVLSAASLALVNGALPTAGELARLVGFFALSYLYLLLFALVGMVTALMTRRTSIALLSALAVWLVVTFVVPQFTFGLRPTASLNPVADVVSTTQRFFAVTATARPLSLAEQYKTATSAVLGTGVAESSGRTALRVLPMLALVLALSLLAARLVGRHDYTTGGRDD